MNKNFFLISAFGKDRAGIVAAVTEVLFELGGNLQDATMTRLGGEFTIMLVVGLPAKVKLPKVQAAFRNLEKRFGLQVTSKSIAPALARNSQRAEATFMVSVYGTDRPGIVYQVAKALAQRKVSVTDLQTKSITKGASQLYVMLLEIQVPSDLDVDDLRTDLDQLRQDLKVDITLQDIEAVAL